MVLSPHPSIPTYSEGCSVGLPLSRVSFRACGLQWGGGTAKHVASSQPTPSTSVSAPVKIRVPLGCPPAPGHSPVYDEPRLFIAALPAAQQLPSGYLGLISLQNLIFPMLVLGLWVLPGVSLTGPHWVAPSGAEKLRRGRKSQWSAPPAEASGARTCVASSVLRVTLSGRCTPPRLSHVPL